MNTNSYIFKRIEKKYFLTDAQYHRFADRIKGCLTPDRYGQSTVCSLYLDTNNFTLIRNSIDAHSYKEKLRVRCYGTPANADTVFFELKKKYNGIVYKRRVEMSLTAALDYLHTGNIPFDNQIMREIDYAMRLYGRPEPAILIAYDRCAFYVSDNPALRITFDSNIRYRFDNLHNLNDTGGTQLLPDKTVLMEIKTDGSVPVWLAHALSDYGIYPGSFSKYGTAYKELFSKERKIS